MNALIVFSHPEPRSFNAALKDVAIGALESSGHQVEVADLYAEGFQPAEGPGHYPDRADPRVFSALGEQRHASRTGTLPAPVRREIDRLDRADLVILQFPLWWHGPPAMLKGWFDRVFVNGSLYTGSMRYDRGRFIGKRAIASVTTGAPEPAFGPGNRGGDMDRMLWPVHYSLHYLGFSVLPAFVSHGIQGHGYAYADDTAAARLRDDCKTEWQRRLERLDDAAPLRFPGWNDWDADGRLVAGSDAAARAAG